MMFHHGHEPTETEKAQALLVQNDLVEFFNRQLGEGMDYRVLLAGLGAASAALLLSTAGKEKIAVWFAQMSALSMRLEVEQP